MGGERRDTGSDIDTAEFGSESIAMSRVAYEVINVVGQPIVSQDHMQDGGKMIERVRLTLGTLRAVFAFR